MSWLSRNSAFRLTGLVAAGVRTTRSFARLSCSGLGNPMSFGWDKTGCEAQIGFSAEPSSFGKLLGSECNGGRTVGWGFDCAGRRRRFVAVAESVVELSRAIGDDRTFSRS